MTHRPTSRLFASPAARPYSPTGTVGGHHPWLGVLLAVLLATGASASLAAELLTGAAAVSHGYEFSCALKSNGTAKCWGYNETGALGNNSTTSSLVAVDVIGVNGATALTSGGGFSCALVAGGAVKCWGYNGYGQLGNNSTTTALVAVDVANVTGAVSLAAGDEHACAVVAGGAVKCWGYNRSGQLGNNSTVTAKTAVDVVGVSGVTAVAAANNQTCALVAGGTIKCWGQNDSGQLGNNSTANALTPVDVVGVNGATAVAAGGQHTCAVVTGGTVKCWGNNTYGQLGNGNTSSSLRAVDVVGLNGVSALAAGEFHTCAVTGGKVKCWGDNAYGQLGDGGTTSVSTPIQAAGVTGATTATAGNHTCVVLGSGGVKCWGANWSGQLGNGTTTDALTAVDVQQAAATGPYTIVVSASPTGTGTVACSPNPVPSGGSSTCTATPIAGYVLSGFSGDCTGPTCTLTNVTAPKVVTANFAPRTYAITTTANPANGGTVACTPNPVSHGSNSTCLATPASGYSFTGFSGSCTGTSCVLTNVTSAKTVTATFATIPPPVAVNFQGLWWNPAEAGWGINFAHQGDTIFATWFTYDTAGKPWWLIALLEKSAEGVYSGPVSTVAGPLFNSNPFGPPPVETPVGTMTVTFADAGHATVKYTVNGVSQTKLVVPQAFGPLPTCTFSSQPDLVHATNYTDLWWNASESGWGINFTHQGDIVFATWFTYDAAGKPWWLIALLNKTGAGTYSGDVSTVTGPSFNANPFDPNKVVETIVGSATATFANGNSATFAYTLGTAATQSKSITRQLFAPPAGTVCSY